MLTRTIIILSLVSSITVSFGSALFYKIKYSERIKAQAEYTEKLEKLENLIEKRIQVSENLSKELSKELSKSNAQTIQAVNKSLNNVILKVEKSPTIIYRDNQCIIDKRFAEYYNSILDINNVK